MTARKPQTVAGIIGKAKPAERTVALCLAGDLNAEVEDLERDLARVGEVTSMADGGGRRVIAEQIETVRGKMRESEVVFRFRAISPKAWSDLITAHPATSEDRAFNTDTFPPALIAACGVDPVFDGPAQVGELFEVLNQGQRDELFDCAWRVNRESVSVPFSVAASVLLGSSGPR